MLYRLTAHALDDIDTLLYEIAERSGWEHSFRVEERIFAAFDQLGLTPGIGHLRSDLIPRELYFHYVEPYLILYRRDTLPIVILAIVHGARDITALAEGGSF